MSKIARKHRRVNLRKQGEKLVAGLDWSQNAEHPDKGKKGGRCNRRACQVPLAGSSNWSMKDYGTVSGRLYYCNSCAADFTDWDLRTGDPIRCSIIEEDRVC